MSSERGKNPSNFSWSSPTSSLPRFLVVEYNGRKVALLRNANYQEFTSSITRNVRGLQTTSNRQVITLAFLEEVKDHVELTEEVWPELLPRLMTIRVELDDEAKSPLTPSHECPGESYQHTAPPSPPHVDVSLAPENLSWLPTNNKPYRTSQANILVVMLTGKTLSFSAEVPVCKISDLKSKIEDREGISSDQQILTFEGKVMEDEKRLSDYAVRNGSVVHLLLKLRGGKPVIYLFPANPTSNIQVQLSLVQSWHFSEIYPPTPITVPTKVIGLLGQTVIWTIDAHPDGTLWDQNTSREIAYLFWEACTNPKLPLSPTITQSSFPVETVSAFDPASPVLLPSHSVLLPFNKVTGYIDDVLLALGLHTEARTSFITYWLPDLSKHAFIALRFLPQHEYEKAAPLDVFPAPQVVTRVFMLFRGVQESQIEYWTDAVAMAQKEVSVWRDIVGVDVARAQDKLLFRVLEWGGMEVK